MKEQVDNPTHYTNCEYEPWDVIADWGLNYAEGCVIKYVKRWRQKNGVKDLKKARNYLNFLIEQEEKLLNRGTVVVHVDEAMEGN